MVSRNRHFALIHHKVLLQNSSFIGWVKILGQMNKIQTLKIGKYLNQLLFMVPTFANIVHQFEIRTTCSYMVCSRHVILSVFADHFLRSNLRIYYFFNYSLLTVFYCDWISSLSHAWLSSAD